MTDVKTLLPAEAFVSDSGKFKPKLTHEQRCQILALVRSGIKRELVGAAFEVDRRTVSHICNPQSPHYRDVRKHYIELGPEEFNKRYLTEEAVLRVRDRKIVVAPKADTSPRADRMAGQHTIPARAGLREYSHRVEIAYLKDGAAGPGWYYRDLDSKTDAEGWYHSGEASLKTSSACFEAIEENLMDD